MRHENQIPSSVKIRPLIPSKDSTRLKPWHMAIHPTLPSYGLHLPLPKYLAQLCAYLRIPVGQLSVNALTALTALQVLWRCAGCSHPTPAEVLQIYRPQLGVRKGHHSVIEFALRLKKGSVPRVHLMDRMPGSQTSWRDSMCLATNGWQFRNAHGVEVFRRYGKWNGLFGATLERMGKNKGINIQDRLGKAVTGFNQALRTHVVQDVVVEPAGA